MDALRSLSKAFIVLAVSFPAFCDKDNRTSSDRFGKNMESEKKANRLIHEKSPYLLQHAYNPVDWYPWGEEAFTKARSEDKPIFLSIGYSTCHWCHVMERESFEVDSIAALMNELFVNIKVDREERPDVDKVYMTALQAMGENGGWPMSMFLTPDLKPFYGGTYFPPENRYGRIGFPELLRRIHSIWKDDRAKVTESADGIVKFLKELSSSATPGDTVRGEVLTLCYNQALKSYDSHFGGFGGGPKFPRPVVFNFLLRYFHRTGEAKALEMCEHTLREMSKGGMYDHIGGGFHRYSVDGEWRVPHFEKMLYDQAQIVSSLVDVYQITKDPFFSEVIRETLGYVLRDMTSEEGGFYSAEDADSPLPDFPHEKGEGAFYVWAKKEIDEILKNDAKAFNFMFGVEEQGNALNDPQHEFTGKNILYAANSFSETAAFLQMSEPDVARTIARSKRILFDVRNQRPRPHLDDKILTGWNGLMISAFARAAQVLGETEYVNAANRAADFVLAKLYDRNTKTLIRRFRDGEAKFEAHLDDYAFFAQGLLDLYETSFDIERLITAIELTRKQIELFWDEANGGFFDTGGKDSSILVRMKEQYDGAEPAGNSVAVMNLLRLSHMTDDGEWRSKAERALSAFGEQLTKAPFTMPQMSAAFDFSQQNVKQIVIAGKKGDAGTIRLLNEVHSRFNPGKVILLADGGEGQAEIAKYVDFIKSVTMIDGKPTAYICEDFVCQLPTSDLRVMAELLEKKSK